MKILLRKSIEGLPPRIITKVGFKTKYGRYNAAERIHKAAFRFARTVFANEAAVEDLRQLDDMISSNILNPLRTARSGSISCKPCPRFYLIRYGDSFTMTFTGDWDASLLVCIVNKNQTWLQRNRVQDLVIRAIEFGKVRNSENSPIYPSALTIINESNEYFGSTVLDV